MDDQLCFALYSATNAVVRAYRPLLENAGLTYSQYLIMLVLWHEGTQSVGELARRLKLSPAAVSPTLDRMDASGLLTRRRDDVDRRLVHVELTDHGRELETTATAAQRDVACRTTLSGNELGELRDSLHDLVERMNAALDGG